MKGSDVKYSTFSNAIAGSKIAKLQESGNYYANKIKIEEKKLVFIINFT